MALFGRNAKEAADHVAQGDSRRARQLRARVTDASQGGSKNVVTVNDLKARHQTGQGGRTGRAIKSMWS